MLDNILNRLYGLNELNEQQAQQLNSLLDVFEENLQLKDDIAIANQQIEELEINLMEVNETLEITQNELNECRNKLNAIQAVISEGLNILNLRNE